MKIKNKIIKLETNNEEYVSVCKRNNLLILHVGYYEAEFTNKQVDNLIKAIKFIKTKGVNIE